MSDDRQLGPDDLREGEPPRVAPGIRLMATDPCSNCGGRVRLAAREDYGVAESSAAWRFAPEIEAEVLATGQIPPAVWHEPSEEIIAVEPGAVTVIAVLCQSCGLVERRAGYRIDRIIG